MAVAIEGKVKIYIIWRLFYKYQLSVNTKRTIWISWKDLWDSKWQIEAGFIDTHGRSDPCGAGKFQVKSRWLQIDLRRRFIQTHGLQRDRD